MKAYETSIGTWVAEWQDFVAVASTRRAAIDALVAMLNNREVA